MTFTTLLPYYLYLGSRLYQRLHSLALRRELQRKGSGHRKRGNVVVTAQWRFGSYRHPRGVRARSAAHKKNKMVDCVNQSNRPSFACTQSAAFPGQETLPAPMTVDEGISTKGRV